jgi:hypothetical protein
MNRFEILQAPPSLSPKELAIHLKMHPELPKEAAAKARTELLNPRVRLHDELTTTRVKVTGRPGPDADPWEIQSWAALQLRTAIRAESAAPEEAVELWSQVIADYTAFFQKADVTQSYAHQLQTEDKSKATVVEAWNDFLIDERTALEERLGRYTGQTQSMMACSQVLAIFDQKGIGTRRNAGQDVIFGAFIQGLQQATDAAQALERYLEVPEPVRQTDSRDELARALLDAATKEATMLPHGFGDADVVYECGQYLDADDKLNPFIAGPLLRSAIEDFFEAIAAYSRFAVNDDQPADIQVKSARLLGLLPSDWVVGQGLVGNDDLTAGQVAESMLMNQYLPEFKEHLDALMEAPGDSAEEEDALAKVIGFCQAHPEFAAGPQTREFFEKIMHDIFSNCFNHYTLDKSARAVRMMQMIAKALPKVETAIGGTTATYARHLERCKAGEAGDLPPQLTSLMKFSGVFQKAAEAPLGTSEENSAIRELIQLVQSNPSMLDDETMNQGYTELLKKTLRGNLGKTLLEEKSTSSTAFRTAEMIARAIPNEEVENGGMTLSTTDHVTMVRAIVDGTNVADSVIRNQLSEQRRPQSSVDSKKVAGVAAAISAVIAVILAAGLWIGVPIGIWFWTAALTTWMRIAAIVGYLIVLTVIAGLLSKRRSK